MSRSIAQGFFRLSLALLLALSGSACGDDETGSSGTLGDGDDAAGDIGVAFDTGNEGDGGSVDGSNGDASTDDIANGDTADGQDAPSDGGIGDDAGGDDASADGNILAEDATGDDVVADGSIGDDAGGGDLGADATDASTGDTGTPDTGAADSGADMVELGGECALPADCSDSFGAAPCGAWECNIGYCEVACPGCDTDGDRDGYGAEQACAGLDCDDANDAIFDFTQESCYSDDRAQLSAPDTVCRAGTRSCLAGVWGQCVGEVTPTAEACNMANDDCDDETDEGIGSFSCGLGACVNTVNACGAMGQIAICTPLASTTSSDATCDGFDDDCDGAIDEDCTTCVYVAIAGGHDGREPLGSLANPYTAIQPAIDWAAADGARPRQVCVATASNGCNPETYAERLTMAEGIAVVGNYRLDFSARCTPNWNRDWDWRTQDPNSIRPAIFTTIEGADFADLGTQTVLDGFRITREGAGNDTAVSVDSSDAYLTFLDIPRDFDSDDTTGIDIFGGSEVFLTQSSVHAGNGVDTAVGVRVVDSRVEIRDNCESYSTGSRQHCDQICTGGTYRGIRGRMTRVDCSVPSDDPDYDCPETFAIYLEDSPDSIIDRSAVCGNVGGETATVYATGDMENLLIRASIISGWGGHILAHGIWLEDCDDSSPYIVDNNTILGSGEDPNALADGIRAEGRCHPVIDGNILIQGGSEGGTADANGVHCLADDDGNPSRCTVINNTRINGAGFGLPMRAAGVRCDDASCVRIAGNEIAANGGLTTYGASLFNTGAVVEDNDIIGGCGENGNYGIYSEDSYARIENNRIVGASYCDPGDGRRAIGLWAVTTGSGNEIDVHSNVIEAGMDGPNCLSMGVLLQADALDPPPGPLGVFRNNAFLGGNCDGDDVDFWEASGAANPRVLENNNFDPRNGVVLYRDGGTTDVTTYTDINTTLVGGSASDMNVEVDCGYVNYSGAFPRNFHLDDGGSPCRDAGTVVGAPVGDMDPNDLRDDGSPDIGPDEYIP